MKIFLSIFIIFFSTSVLASYDKSEYKGKKALMDKKYSLDIGWNLEWLSECAKTFDSNKLKNKIRKISYADFKNIEKGVEKWRSGTGKATGCSQSGEIIRDAEVYISNLQSEALIKINIKTSNNSNELQLMSNQSKYIYCKDKYGVYKYLKDGNCYDSQTKISERQYLDSATYCEKKNGEIYISQFNDCKSYEKKSSKLQYNKKKNNNEKESQDIADKFNTKIEYILNKVIYIENRIKSEISDLENINKNFNSKSSKNLSSSEYYFNQEIDKISKEINNLEKEISNLKVGNLIKNKIKNNFKKISNKPFIIYRLISEYTNEYDKYIKSINIENSYSKITTQAEQAIVIDFNQNKILFEKNSDVKFPPASMTKIMTAYVVFDKLKNTNLSIGNTCLVSAKSYRMGGSRTFLEINDRVNIHDLLKGMIIQSGNDASVALAECLAGTEDDFVKLMNVYAKKLGMINTNFLNSSGWPVFNQYSTVKDLAILSNEIIKKFPYFYDYFSIEEFTYNDIKQPNRNKLLNEVRGVDGLKTGFTKMSGWGISTSAKRLNQRITVVINGANSSISRLNETKKLINWGFDNIRKEVKNESISEIKIEENKINKKIQGIYYTIANANFRDKPNASNSKILTTIPKGTSVDVLGVPNELLPNDDWVQVKYNNLIGYIYFELLNKIKPEIKKETSTENMTPEEMMQLALDNLPNKNFEKAKEIFSKVIEMYPQNQLSGSAHFWLGRIYEFEKNFRKAAIIYGEGIQKFPNSIKAPEMWYNLSQMLVELNKIPEACKSLSILNEKYENNIFKTMAEESIKELNCKEKETSKKQDTKIIEEPLTEQEQALVNLYYSELKKLYDLIDMQLITNEDYISRKELIINQIISLNLKNISHFLIKLLAEQLITAEEFEILNKNNISIKKNEEEEIKTKDNNDSIELSELFKDLKNDNTIVEVEKKSNQEMTIYERDLVIQQLNSCFNPRAGTIIEGDEFIKIYAQINKQAYVNINTVQIIDTNISESNPYYVAITESAKAIFYNPLCAKLKLPLDKYEEWKNLTINVDYSWMKN